MEERLKFHSREGETERARSRGSSSGERPARPRISRGEEQLSFAQEWKESFGKSGSPHGEAGESLEALNEG